LKNNQPPKWIIKLLERSLAPRLYDAIIGDLLEDFDQQVHVLGHKKAKLKFLTAAFGVIRQNRLRKIKTKQHSNFNAMFKNYLKTSFRSFSRRKAYFFLNILGLSIGLASFIAIQKYVMLERSYDKFHDNAADVKRILQYDAGNQNYSVGNKPDLASKLLTQLPGIEYATRFYNRNNGVLQYESNGKKDLFNDFDLFYTDEHFFSIFSFPIEKGNHNNPLANSNSIVLTKSFAAKIFGDVNPIGKTVYFKDPNFALLPCIVTAVVEDVPKNSHFKFNALLSMKTPVRDGLSVDKMGWKAYSTYVKVNNAGINDEQLERVARTHFIDNENLGLRQQPITDIHLNSSALFEVGQNGDKRLINYLSMTSFFILLMAYFNYINFSTAKSLERAKEVGVRKVLGSRKSDLTIQFLIETFIINIISLVFALGLLVVLAPIIPITTVGFDIESIFQFYGNELIFIGIAFFAGTLISGLYPAIVMASFKPSIILKGKLSNSGNGKIFRGFLTSIQSTISVALVIITTVIYSQINFMINSEKGADITDVLVIETPDIRGDNYRTQLGVYRNKLLSHPFIESVSTSSTLPGNSLNYATPARLPNQRVEASIMLNTDGIDENFIDHYDIKLLAGRTFDTSFGDERSKVLLNETAIRLLGINNPEEAIEAKILMEGDTFSVIGIMNDYNHFSLKQHVNAQVFQYYGSWVAHFSVKMNSNSQENMAHQLTQLEEGYHEAFGNNTFNPKFLEQSFDAQYDEDKQFGNISGFFSAIAIIIAILGLLGFIAFTVSIKSKEIAIRKVLGARKRGIIFNISKSALLLNLISGIFAAGFAYYFLEGWLNQYASQLNLSVMHFVIPIIGLISIIGLIIVVQTLKLLSKNPVSAINSDS
jgi:putative ABC transport system permease protein